MDEIESKSGLKFVYIPAGDFWMGSEKVDDEQYSDEKPMRRVRLDGFWMSENLVTVEQYEAYCAATGATTPPAPDYNYWLNEKHYPVVNVTWEEAQRYCAWAGGRLPTEAEWEYAARGGLEGKEYPWGDGFDRKMLQCSEEWGDSGGACDVGRYPANGYGLYDMAGNVWEWCADWYGVYDPNDTENPKGAPTGEWRVGRGASWCYDNPACFRCAYRSGSEPYSKSGHTGFRVVR